MTIPGDYHRPGENVAVEGLVTSHDGQPVANAEVTLYAEDEGTLAVAGYRNPNPMSFFYAPRSLRTNAGTSLDNFISEDSERRYFFNKGFVVGGGGDFEADPSAADDQDGTAACEVLAQGQRVVDAAQVIDAGQVGGSSQLFGR